MTEPDKTAIRDAATVIVMRDHAHAPAVLMGQRGANAVFMPKKFVFPGGAVDAADHDVPLIQDVAEPCYSRLTDDSPPDMQRALAAAAIRELWEETGLILGTPGAWPGPVPDNWNSFAQQGFRPSAEGLHFVFRALTPPGRPRRFDARFFLVNADQIQGDLDDFTHACDELSHLQWIPLTEARSFDLPFITEVALAEIGARLDHIGPPPSVPFFKNNDEESLFKRLYGYALASD